MTMDNLLTIAIPTFNRSRYLAGLLPRILEQARSVNQEGNRVQILVSDNHSTDGTEDLAREAFKAIPWAYYYRNDENVGGDANFILCVDRAVGKYVWLFGDDDVITDGAIGRVCRALESTNPALLIGRSSSSRSRYYPSYKAALAGCLVKDLVFPTHHTLITANVFLKERFDVAVAVDRRNTNYGHMYAIMGILRGVEDGVFVLSRRAAAFAIRNVRAPFEIAPSNLGKKLIAYLGDLASEMDYPFLRLSTRIFFGYINKVMGLINPIKTSLKRALHAWRRAGG